MDDRLKANKVEANLAIHMQNVLDRFDLTYSRLLGITTYNDTSNDLMTFKLQWTLEDSGIQWAVLKYHITCMAHVKRLALCAFMSSLGENGHTKSSKAHECDQQFRENESKDIGNSQRLRKEGNAGINKVSAMTPGSGKIIEKLSISTCFESPETDLHIGENACTKDYPDTWLSKRVHWVSQCQGQHCGPSYYRWEDTLGPDTGVAWACLLINTIHLWAAPQSKNQRLPATVHNTGWMDNC